MAGRWTFDSGCGACRFAEVAAQTGARLVAVDYSTAVDACRENLPFSRRFDVVQADVYQAGLLPLSSRQLREWALLDTFDMLAPAHDHPQSVSTVRSWFDDAGLDGVEVFRLGLVVGRGRQPA